MRDAGMKVIGGLRTPMKKEHLRLLLRGNQSLVICPARSIEKMGMTADWRHALGEQWLLVLSPVSEH